MSTSNQQCDQAAKSIEDIVRNRCDLVGRYIAVNETPMDTITLCNNCKGKQCGQAAKISEGAIGNRRDVVGRQIPVHGTRMKRNYVEKEV